MQRIAAILALVVSLSAARAFIGASVPWTTYEAEAMETGRPELASRAIADGYQLLVPYDMATIYNYKSLWTASTPITGSWSSCATGPISPWMR